MNLTTKEANAITQEIYAEIKRTLGGRKIDGRLYGSIFRHAERRAHAGLRPWLTDELREILDKFAE